MCWLSLLLLVPAAPPVLDSEDFTKADQTAALVATVRRQPLPPRQGSGVIVKQEGPFVYVLTANHVVDEGEALEVSSFSEASHPKPANTYRSVEVLARAPGADLAVLRVATRDPVPGTVRLCPPRLVPEGAAVALSVGCDEGGAPSCLEEKALAKKRVQKPGAQQATWCWEVPTAPAKGRSGGPLLDRRGNLIGLASGVGDGKGYYAHVLEIHTFLRSNGLKWLYE